MLAIENRTGDPITVGGANLVPVARSVRLQLGIFGLTWARPVGVRLEADSGESWVPTRDHTRRIQLALFGVGLLGTLALRRGRRRGRPRREESWR